MIRLGYTTCMLESYTYSTSDSGETWQPSPLVITVLMGPYQVTIFNPLMMALATNIYLFKLIAGPTALSGHGSIFFTVCSLSFQDGGKTYDNIDWHGTDGVDTDAMTSFVSTTMVYCRSA